MSAEKQMYAHRLKPLNHSSSEMSLLKQRPLLIPSITQLVLRKLEHIDVNDIQFQPDSSACHRDRETIQLVHETSSGRILSRFDDQS